MKKKDFQDIFCSAFSDSEAWRKWFFDEIVVDENEIHISRDGTGKAVGALLMQAYDFLYQGYKLPSDYMSCVATRPEARAHGVASRLIGSAMADAKMRGVALCELIPAEEHLFDFYRRFGFATVFYVDRYRYTALHTFNDEDAEFFDPDFLTFNALEHKRGCTVLHSETDFGRILADLAIDGGKAFAARMPDGTVGMAFAAEADKTIRVKSLLADTASASDAVLAAVRRHFGKMPMIVNGPPLSGEKSFLRPYGMARILDPEQVLGALAAAHPSLNIAIRLSDCILSANNGIYTVRDGQCRRPDAFGGCIDLEISVETLAALLFSSERMAAVFDIPARRPYMSLMLD